MSFEHVHQFVCVSFFPFPFSLFAFLGWEVDFDCINFCSLSICFFTSENKVLLGGVTRILVMNKVTLNESAIFVSLSYALLSRDVTIQGLHRKK